MNRIDPACPVFRGRRGGRRYSEWSGLELKLTSSRAIDDSAIGDEVWMPKAET